MSRERTIGERPPRLLQVTTSFVTLRAFLLPFAQHFRAAGWRVDAAADGVSGSPECREAFDNVWDVRWSRSPLTWTNLWEAPRLMRRIVREGDYDLVHVHTPVASFLTRLALRKLRRGGRPRVIYTAHGFHFHKHGRPLKNKIFQMFERMAGRHTDYLVTINQEDYQAARDLQIVAPDHVRYMPGIGVSPEQYDPNAVSEDQVSAARDELKLKSSDRLFLMVAEFNPGKRHVDLLRAMDKLNRPDVHVALAGDGKLMEQTRELAVQLGLADRVHFLGFRRDLPVWIRAAEAMIAPSQREGLPRCIMEAMCLGLPVIASRIRGQEDLLSGGCGLLFELANVDELAERLGWALDHPDEMQRNAERARARMDEYDVRRIIELHEKLYEQALSEG